MKMTTIAALALAGLLTMSSAASAQVCVIAIIAKALYASAADNRELTQKEAMTCGLIRGDEAADSAKDATKTAKKPARSAKKPAATGN